MPTAMSRFSAARCRCRNASDSIHQRNNSYCSSGSSSAAAALIFSTAVMFQEYYSAMSVVHRHSGSLLPLHLSRHFQSQRVEPDEARRVVLIVGLRRVGFHRGDVRVIEAHLGLATRNHDVALI